VRNRAKRRTGAGKVNGLNEDRGDRPVYIWFSVGETNANKLTEGGAGKKHREKGKAKLHGRRRGKVSRSKKGGGRAKAPEK